MKTDVLLYKELRISTKMCVAAVTKDNTCAMTDFKGPLGEQTLGTFSATGKVQRFNVIFSSLMCCDEFLCK